jgi:hypothetical protein
MGVRVPLTGIPGFEPTILQAVEGTFSRLSEAIEPTRPEEIVGQADEPLAHVRQPDLSNSVQG